MQSNIFRKVSIERLSSPEQLDQLMQVTTLKSWIALSAVGGLLFIAVLWGIFGSVPTRVQGMGVLIKTGGVYDVVPLASGQITDIAVRSGDRVREGQVIARIDQPRLADQLTKARMQLEELKNRHRQLERFGSVDARLQSDLADQQAINLEQAIQGAKEQITWLEEKIENQTKLLEEGLITRQALLATKQQLQSTKERAKQLDNERKQVSIRELTLENQREQDLLASRMQINDLEREIGQMEDQFRLATEVTSPYTGRILEVMAEAGSIAREGQPIMRLDRVGDNIQDLEAVLYIPGIDGKKIKPGMDVQISPTTVRREEYGFMKASVTRISDFPATPEGMMRTLKNNQLVQTFSQTGTPYETYASLRLDPATMSGYQWSSSKGPDTRIQSGTICTATVTVTRQRPAEMVLPALRKFFGV